MSNTETTTHVCDTEAMLNERVEQFNLKAEKYAKEKGVRFAKPIDFDANAMVMFAVEGFKAKLYRQKYNKSRWQQLKAIKDLAESKGVSIEDLLQDLAE